MLKPTLLFDSACPRCSDVAALVRASGSRLEVRSLHEPDIKELLDNALPGWNWEPMLIEGSEDRVRVHKGFGLRLRLISLLGPRQALAVARAASQTQPSRTGVDRRSFLARSAAAAGGLVGVLLGLDSIASTAQASPITSTPASAATVAQLKTSPSIPSATAAFGPPQWSNTTTQTQNGQTSHVIPLQTDDGVATALVLMPTAPQPQVASGADRNLLTNDVVVQIAKAPTPTMTWSTVDGRTLASVNLDGTSDITVGEAGYAYTTAVTGVTVSPDCVDVVTDAATPDVGCISASAFNRCMATCVGATWSPACAMNCLSCAEGHAIYCTSCLLCGALNIRGCFLQCAGFRLPA